MESYRMLQKVQEHPRMRRNILELAGMFQKVTERHTPCDIGHAFVTFCHTCDICHSINYHRIQQKAIERSRIISHEKVYKELTPSSKERQLTHNLLPLSLSTQQLLATGQQLSPLSPLLSITHPLLLYPFSPRPLLCLTSLGLSG